MDLFKTIRKHCSEVDENLLQQHFARMPENYFERHSPSQIAKHLKLLASLTADEMVCVEMQRSAGQGFEITIVGEDHNGVLAAMTTALLAEGFGIQNLSVASYVEEENRQGYFVDVFEVSGKLQTGTLAECSARLQMRLQKSFEKLIADPDSFVPKLEDDEGSTKGDVQPNEVTVVQKHTLHGMVLDSEYQLQHKLATSGMSEIFMAQRLSDGSPSVVKVMRMREDVNPTEMEHRFWREVETLRGFEHPHVTALLAAGTVRDRAGNERPWMALEFLAGGDVSTYIRQHGAVAPDVGIRWLKQSLTALEYAHHHGILHRDIKPHNLLLDAESNLKLTDFGLLKQPLEVEMHQTLPGLVMGTPQYMSPEQASGQRLDERSDIFSLGITFYQILTGRLPFGPDESTAAAIAHADPPPLSSFSADLAGPLSTIIGRMIARFPEDRYQDVGVIVHDLQSYERRGLLKAASSAGWNRTSNPSQLKVASPA